VYGLSDQLTGVNTPTCGVCVTPVSGPIDGMQPIEKMPVLKLRARAEYLRIEESCVELSRSRTPPTTNSKNIMPTSPQRCFRRTRSTTSSSRTSRSEIGTVIAFRPRLHSIFQKCSKYLYVLKTLNMFFEPFAPLTDAFILLDIEANSVSSFDGKLSASFNKNFHQDNPTIP